MATAKRIYTASYDQADNAPNSGFYSERRPFGYESMFSSNVYKNLDKTYTLLATGGTYSLNTNQNDSADWHNIINFNHIMKSSTGSNYARVEWDVKSSYYNMIGMGPYFGDVNCFFHPNVIGATFTWRKSESYWSDGECGFKHWGLLYYQPSSNRWRAVRFNTHQSSGNRYTSNEGDDWVHHNGNPAAFGTAVNGWKATRGMLGASSKNYVLTEEWLWGGFYIRAECTDRGGSSHWRKLDLSDFQPIYGYTRDSAKLILPFGSYSKSDIRNNSRRLIRT